MSDMTTFPDTWEEYERSYGFYAPKAGDGSYTLGYCPFIGSHLVMSKGFCAWGERREGESQGGKK